MSGFELDSDEPRREFVITVPLPNVRLRQTRSAQNSIAIARRTWPWLIGDLTMVKDAIQYRRSDGHVR